MHRTGGFLCIKLELCFLFSLDNWESLPEQWIVERMICWVHLWLWLIYMIWNGKFSICLLIRSMMEIGPTPVIGRVITHWPPNAYHHYITTNISIPLLPWWPASKLPLFTNVVGSRLFTAGLLATTAWVVRPSTTRGASTAGLQVIVKVGTEEWANDTYRSPDHNSLHSWGCSNAGYIRVDLTLPVEEFVDTSYRAEINLVVQDGGHSSVNSRSLLL